MARTGRPHKPTHLKLVTGTLKTMRKNKAEPMPGLAMPTPPPELSAEARQEWDGVSRRLYACGLLTAIDGSILAAYCQAYGRWRQAERVLADMSRRDPLTFGLMIKSAKNNAIQNPLVGTANKAMADMIRYAIELGMTPSARSRVQANLDKPSDNADRFF